MARAELVHCVGIQAGDGMVEAKESKNWLPIVSILMPIRNEARYIERSLAAVLAQDYPKDRLEVLVVDGMSTDGTRDSVGRKVLRESNVRLLDNPSGIVPPGLNIGLREARGEIIIRVDGHCEIASDYVRKCVNYLSETGADCVGGPIKTIGEDYSSETIALAMSSTFGVGNARFRTSQFEGYVDTLAFGAYRREVFERVGVFDEELVRNQDDEFNFRMTRAGYKIFLTPAIKSVYYSRASLSGLWKQYFQYGFWKLRVVQKHGAVPSWRHAVAPVFVVGLLFSLLMPLLTSSVWTGGAVLVPYVLANMLASLLVASRWGWKYVSLLPLAFAIIHLAYGSGFWVGMLRFGLRNSSRVRRPVV